MIKKEDIDELKENVHKFKSNFKNHFKTITVHKAEVFKNCFKCGLIIQGLTHDLSKYTPGEFIPGVLHYQGYRSPNEGEREDYGYSKAWMHHKGRNKHHFEYWTDYDIVTKKMKYVKMPKRYVLEMFCDRVAASKVYKGDEYTDDCPLEYFLKGNAKKVMNSETAEEIGFLLKYLADHGEKETFKYIRKIVFLNKPIIKKGGK